MSLFTKDPLVGLLHAVIAFLMAVVAFGMLVAAAAFIAVTFFQGELAVEIAGKSGGMAVWQVVLIRAAKFAGVLVLLGTVEYFFLLLWRMLASVRQGDPFTPINTLRLQRMAWIALAGNVWAWLLALYAAGFVSFFPDEDRKADFDADFGGIGIVLTLVLFVLARVFRRGTEMRAELEGTV